MENVTRHAAFLCLGSNLGDRRKALREAEDALSRGGVFVDGRSSIYETEPVDVTDQPWFLNRVLHVRTDRSALSLLDLCKRIEHVAGRLPTVRYGPRVLDIDILLYDDVTLDHPRLTLPHPQMHTRRFVLVPLLELAPNVRHPNTGTQYKEMLDQLDEGKKVLKSIPNES